MSFSSLLDEAPGLKFRTENRPVSSRLLAKENALPAIASRSRGGKVWRFVRKREEKDQGEESAEKIGETRRNGHSKRARGSPLKDRHNLDAAPVKPVSVVTAIETVARPFSLALTLPSSAFHSELFAEDLRRGVSIP